MRLIVLFLSLLLGLTASGQQQSIDTLLTSFESRAGNRPVDIVYLQTSKGIYETGEDLWFKAYQLNAQTFGLSDQSQTLFVEMIHEAADTAVWQEKYPIENGIAAGHIFVKEHLPEGDYRLEAYTHSSFYTDSTVMNAYRKIKILKNIMSKNASTPSVGKGKETIRFETFPEGGNLVAGITSRLAFKATDGKGNPVEVEGTFCQNDEPLAELKSTYSGMGVVSICPLAGKTYQIRLNNGNTYPLSDIYPQGICMQLIGQNSDFAEFRITQGEGLGQRPIYLLGQLRGIPCCSARGLLRDSLTIKIPLKEFPLQGIAEFTLFDEHLQPVAERLVYVHPDKKLYISAETDKKKYKLREKATVKIKVTDENKQPVVANLGIRVFDEAYGNPEAPGNILTYSYLTSQIRGKIHDPEYYFDETHKDRTEAMDLLLMTQGWRRYVWNITNLQPEGEPFLKDEITGHQTTSSNKKKQEKLSGSQQLLQASGPEGNAQFVQVDSSGRFVVDTDIQKVLRGGYIYLKPMLTAEFKPKLFIDNTFTSLDSIRKLKWREEPFIDPSLIRHAPILRLPLVSQDSVIQLDEVTITSKARRPFRDKFMGRLDSLAQMDFGPWVCEEGHLENYKDGYTCHHDPRYCPRPNPVKTKSKPIEGKSYYIFKPKYSEGGNYFTVEACETVVYHGPLYSEEELLRQNNLWRTKGYYAAREFYQPDEVDIQISLPDARNTLLWAPSVQTDEKGEATVSFYCSDINTGFTGQFEGVDGNGLLGNSEIEFRVIREL